MLLEELGDALLAAARSHGWELPNDEDRVLLEVPRESAHGDVATNLAMLLARTARRPPREVAEKLIAALPLGPETVSRIDIAGPGFLNFHVTDAALAGVLREVLDRGADYGRSDAGRKLRVQVEFVSANPTGPMNVVNARAAAVGNALARILAFAGYDVQSEFYVNDAGRQVDLLGLSFQARYAQARGEERAFPEEGYQGEYVRTLAEEFPPEEAAAALADPSARRFREWALQRMVAWQRDDLAHYGIRFDHWFPESALHAGGHLERALADLERAGHVYDAEGARWFRSSAFGDEKDRVLVRANGEPTYFLADIAYHRDKWERGFRRVIDVWGPDHHGHIARLRAALLALGLPEDFFVVEIVQWVKLLASGQPVKMSKRAGEFVTLRELVDEVGADNAKYFFLLRSTSAPLDFDLDLAKAQNDDNPAYYVQYAHARISSLVRYAETHGVVPPAAGEVPAGLESPEERALLKDLALFPEIVRGAARAREPHRVPGYLRGVAEGFHRFYHVHRVVTEDAARSSARLALCLGVRQVLKNGLDLLGVSAPERM